LRNLVLKRAHLVLKFLFAPGFLFLAIHQHLRLGAGGARLQLLDLARQFLFAIRRFFLQFGNAVALLRASWSAFSRQALAPSTCACSISIWVRSSCASPSDAPETGVPEPPPRAP
jgi:hypothetical protein